MRVDTGYLLNVGVSVVRSANLKCAKSICSSGLLVRTFLHPLRVLRSNILFACTHTPLLGQITRHPPVVETNAQALRSRAQPRLQIMYGSSL